MSAMGFCELCKTLHPYNELSFVADGRLLCRDCMKRENLTIQCDRCGRWIEDEEFNRVRFIDEASGELVIQSLCPYCMNKTLGFHNMSTCECCGENWYTPHTLYGYSIKKRDYIHVCPECMGHREENLGEVIWGLEDEENIIETPMINVSYGPVKHGHYFDPDIIDQGNPNGNGLRFGVEIEMSGGGTDSFKANRLASVLGKSWVRVVEDASLYDGLEFCTYPMTLMQFSNKGYYHSIKNFFTLAAKLGYYTGTESGLHVHVTNTYLTPDMNPFKVDEVRKLMWRFFYVYQNELKAISGRKYGESSYATFPESPDKIDGDRYHAINLYTHKPTYEYRFWAGTMSPRILMARVRFSILLTRYFKLLLNKVKRNPFKHHMSFMAVCYDMGALHDSYTSPYVRHMLRKYTRKLLKENKKS